MTEPAVGEVQNEEFWKRIDKENKILAKEDVEGWSGMLETQKEFMDNLINVRDALNELSDFLGDYPTNFIALQTELQKATDYTEFAITTCQGNLACAKQRQSGSKKQLHTIT